MREQLLVGPDYLAAATHLLQRSRKAHPTHGSFEAAEVQFWWSIPRSTDDVGQLFWFNDAGQPEAAVIVTDFGDGSSLLYSNPTVTVLVMPNADSQLIARVVDRGLAHVRGLGIATVELEVDRADDAMRSLLIDHGFTTRGLGLQECWLDAAKRPEVSVLRENYRLFTRSETADRLPHHMTHPRRPNLEERLQQTSLYRADLDLVVLDETDSTAAYGMFWFDPETAVGVVEPMRTADAHQRRGLGRHILTSGIERLVVAGAERISIAFEPDNPAASHLYLSVGFEPHRQTEVFAGTASTAAKVCLD